MTILSKKQLTCKPCGKQYETRISIGKHLCTECSKILNQKNEAISGYHEARMDEIIVH